MIYKPGKTIGYALLLWIIGFVWGTIVFMVPVLKNIGSIPYVSKFPAISVPLLIVLLVLLYFLSKSYLKEIVQKVQSGLILGLVIFVINFVLDLIVYFLLFKSTDYFAYLSIWLSYVIMILIPWLTGRSLQNGSNK